MAFNLHWFGLGIVLDYYCTSLCLLNYSSMVHKWVHLGQYVPNSPVPKRYVTWCVLMNYMHGDSMGKRSKITSGREIKAKRLWNCCGDPVELTFICLRVDTTRSRGLNYHIVHYQDEATQERHHLYAVSRHVYFRSPCISRADISTRLICSRARLQNLISIDAHS